MRRWSWIGVLLLAILAGTAIGVGAYNAGVSHGLAQTGHAVQIVREVGPGYGFFPFGFLLFPLFFFAIFAIARGLFWGRRWGGHAYGHGGPEHSAGGGHARFEDWHRRQHERGSVDHPGPGGEQAGV